MVWVQLEPSKPPSEQPYAFMDGDFTFLDENFRPLYRGDRAKAAFVRIRWHTKKNKNNEGTKLFAVATDDRRCPMGTARRIANYY